MSTEVLETYRGFK